MATNTDQQLWQPETPFLNEMLGQGRPDGASMEFQPQLFESPFAGEHPFLRETEGDQESVSLAHFIGRDSGCGSAPAEQAALAISGAFGLLQ